VAVLRRSLPNAAATQQKLFDLCKSVNKHDKRKLSLTPESKKAFEDAKDQLINATLLAPIS
jgi:hypothetical protein